MGATVPENARPQGLAPSETSAAERAGFPKPARPARVEKARRSGGSNSRPARAYFEKDVTACARRPGEAINETAAPE